MGQNTDSLVRFIQYSMKVLPELKRQNSTLFSQADCPAQVSGNIAAYPETGPYPAEKLSTPVLCSGFFALQPGVDRKGTLSFLLSLYKLADLLDSFRANAEITDEPALRKLYGCLSGAVDPSRSICCAFGNPVKARESQKVEPASALCLSDQCRLQLAVLPSLSLASPKLKKYMQFYVDLHSYMHYPESTRKEYLQTWSDYYLKRYPGISCMEFCAASDSLLGIVAMYASAANPKMTSDEIRLLDDACFPWLCGLEALLRAFVRTRLSENPVEVNFCSHYPNLKECEQRLLYFAVKAEEACLKLKDRNFYLSLLRILIAMYLSEPEAGFGMYRLASLNILKNGPHRTMLYYNGCRLLRLLRMPS